MPSGRILIVDDERTVRLMYRVALETRGYTVAEAANGADALKQLPTGAFDLVLLDLRMPEMNGMELLQSMRALDLGTPTVIITAYGEVAQAVEAMKLGAIDFLAKTISPEELRQVVGDILQRHRPAFDRHPPHDFEGHLEAAKRLLNQRAFSDAKEHLVKALKFNENSPDAVNLAGVMYEMQEDYTRAERSYKQALRLDRKYEAAHTNLQRIFELFHYGSSRKPFQLE